MKREGPSGPSFFDATRKNVTNMSELPFLKETVLSFEHIPVESLVVFYDDYSSLVTGVVYKKISPSEVTPLRRGLYPITVSKTARTYLVRPDQLTYTEECADIRHETLPGEERIKIASGVIFVLNGELYKNVPDSVDVVERVSTGVRYQANNFMTYRYQFKLDERRAKGLDGRVGELLHGLLQELRYDGTIKVVSLGDCMSPLLTRAQAVAHAATIGELQERSKKELDELLEASTKKEVEEVSEDVELRDIGLHGDIYLRCRLLPFEALEEDDYFIYGIELYRKISTEEAQCVSSNLPKPSNKTFKPQEAVWRKGPLLYTTLEWHSARKVQPRRGATILAVDLSGTSLQPVSVLAAHDLPPYFIYAYLNGRDT